LGAEEVDAARGKSGNREDEVLDRGCSCPSPAVGKVAVVTGGEGSGDGSMAVRGCELTRDGETEREGGTRWSRASMIYGLLSP
jgi:hypothetical protein